MRSAPQGALQVIFALISEPDSRHSKNLDVHGVSKKRNFVSRPKYCSEKISPFSRFLWNVFDTFVMTAHNVWLVRHGGEIPSVPEAVAVPVAFL